MLKVDIVLATYNGAKFIEEQITSIQNNTFYTDVVARFIIVDDGSSDQTLMIVKSLATFDNKIELHSNLSEQHGPKGNFSYGLSLSTAELVMLSDQDDFWLPSKIEKTYQRAINFNTNQPVAVFTDLNVVDENLTVISDSYFSLKGISKSWHLSFDNLIQQNVVSGCTMMINRELINLALPIPTGAYMHDWWLAIVAKAYGELAFVDEPLMLYRQHDNNTIGAQSRSLFSLLSRFSSNMTAFVKSVNEVKKQAEAFNLIHSKTSQIDSVALEVLSSYSTTSKLSLIRSWVVGDISRSNVLGKVALLIYILKSNNQK